jgi:hypothetical protein
MNDAISETGETGKAPRAKKRHAQNGILSGELAPARNSFQGSRSGARRGGPNPQDPKVGGF